MPSTETAKTETKTSNVAQGNSKLATWCTLAAVGVLALGAIAFRSQWLPMVEQMTAAAKSNQPAAAHDDHAGHGHAAHAVDDTHAGHNDANSLQLSPQARKSMGLQISPIKLQTYVRSTSMPAIVVGRAGRSQVEVTAPLGGRVTRVYLIEGEAVEPGQPLFDLRLTHEELVQAQSDLLRSAEQLDVEQREIQRLESIVESGVVPGNRLLERKYEKQKIEASLNAQRQSLLLHGLTDQEVNDIIEKRKLVQATTVVAPAHSENKTSPQDAHPFTVRKLSVKPGQYVETGATLCLLMDYSELYIEGRAFEQDADELLRADQGDWEITAVREDNQAQPEMIEGLKIVYVANEVDPESRALHFFVGLPNRIVNQSKSAEGHRFLTWKYKPGQRMQLQVPVEEWPERIVLPVDAVAKEGAEHYVFQQNGGHFDRVPVQIEYQDQFYAVVANDGSIFPGDTVATSGAHQMQMALKNKSGGAVDPHAGHNH